jgi:hypothetical protein
MLIDLNSEQGEWFQFFTSRLDPNTGEVIYDPPTGDARAQIRSLAPFFEERAGKRKKAVEHVYNPKTRAMERIPYFEEQTLEEIKAEREDAYDYAITGLENFKDSKTGTVITCTRGNKVALMKVPVFDRYFARCQQLLASSGVKKAEEEPKNLPTG